MNVDKITYSREEGGFTQHINGKPVATFRIKGWMNNLRETPERSYSNAHKPSNKFYRTQFEYHGKLQ